MKGMVLGYRLGSGCFFLWALSLLAGDRAAVAQEGYRLRADRLVVETAAHWQAWTLPTHAVEVTPTGTVVPHRFRSRYNLLDDRHTFQRALKDFKRGRTQTAILNLDSTLTLDIRGNVLTQKKSGQTVPVYTYLMRMGISRVGSNAADAAAILDGDRTTYWEPSAAAPLDDWWVEVDLGRVAVVDSVVLHFVEASLGDPFRQFRLLVAPDQNPVLEEAGKVEFELVARTTEPNEDQRTFGFGFSQPRASPEWTGRMVETLRVVVTDSKRARGRQVSAAEWEDLPTTDQGEIVHFVKVREGFEEPVDRLVYEGLPVSRQGRREYYRRERPRLADIEVWGYGDNISIGMVGGGGSLALTGDGFSPGAGFDGDYDTYFVHPFREKTAIVDRGVLTIDMGATFWLDAVRTSAPFSWPIVDGYKMLGSDGTRDTNGRLKWSRLTSLERENNSISRFRHLLENFASPQKLRYIEITIVDQSLDIYAPGPKITEYQLFSEGYPSEVVLYSDLMALPPGRSLGRIFWEGQTPPGTQLDLRSRTGSLLRKVVRYFDKSGSEITQKQWNNLMGSFKGPVDTAFVIGSDWSNWSRSYRQPGSRVKAPVQHGFLQLQVALSTQDRVQAASIGSIEIELLNPVVEQMPAEVWPVEVAVPGQIDTFAVFAQPFFVERPFNVRSDGFDEVLLTLSGAQHLTLLELALGDEQRFQRQADGSLIDDTGQALTVLQDRSDSIWVRLPAAVHALGTTDERIYYQVMGEQEQVPVDRQGQVLTAAGYGQLAPEERGDQRYFRRTVEATGEVSLTPVNESEFDVLAEDEREARYFRILFDEGGQFAFDTAGDSLDATAYNGLASARRGRIVGAGPLMRLQFATPVFVNGATVDLAVRNTAGGSAPDAPWQGVAAGDATAQVASEALSIQVPLNLQPLDAVVVDPNPFTPNGDGINDQTTIGFSVFRLGTTRQVTVSVYRLDGRRVWQHRQAVQSGAVAVAWPGVDQAGQRVPPGIYVGQVNLAVDAHDIGPTTKSTLIHVAY